MADLGQRLLAVSERLRDLAGPPPLALCDEVYDLAREAADSDSEAWKHQASLERERGNAAEELLMQWALALVPPMPGRWHFGGGRVPHRVSQCTDDTCWSPIPMPDGRRGQLRLGWDVDLTMVSPQQVVRFDPEPSDSEGKQP